jgi:hypothetical protein
MWNSPGSGSVITLAPRELEIKEARGYDVSPDIIDQFDDEIFVAPR